MLDGKDEAVGVAGRTLIDVRGDRGVLTTVEVTEAEEVDEALEWE
jgi:hypothetical protein